MMLAQLCDTRVQAAERTAVGRQHQRIGRQAGELVERRQVLGQRIALRLDGEHRNIGGYARQHHVAGDQHVQGFAVQRGMLRRMTEAGDDAPLLLANLDQVAILHAGIGLRNSRHQRRIIIAALAHALDQLRVEQSVALEMRQCGRAVDARQGGRHHARETVFAGRHPERRAGAGAQPVRQAHVVRVAMGGEHAHQRFGPGALRQHLVPGGAGGVVGDAAIDGGPAAAALELIAQQPQVDMVEGKRQRHAQPVQAGRQFGQRSRRGQHVAKRIVQLRFGRIHQALSWPFGRWRATMHFTLT